MPFRTARRPLCRLLAGLALSAAAMAALAQGRTLPAEVAAALDRAKVPREAISVLVQDVSGNGPPRLSWQSQVPVNPASLIKLVTTSAALDLLGPAYTWVTPVWLQGSWRPGSNGVFEGDLVIKGTGDPKLVLERLWLLLRRVQQLGVREIRGDIVLDRSAFEVPPQNPADFDGEALRPYNAGADALLLNYRSVSFTFTPDVARGIAMVSSEPPLAGVRVDSRVPLATGAAAQACNDWRDALQADLTDAQRLRFKGVYSPACGEKLWPLAYPDPASYNERVLTGLWVEMGGQLSGRVRDGKAPDTPPTFSVSSPSLAEVIRDINKFSNNVMAQQLFLTLALNQRGSGTPDNAREVLRQWLSARFGEAGRTAVIDNGSGLSRESRVSAQLLARLLQDAAGGAQMSELMSSLPVNGVDGTMKRSKAPQGRAHIKTGSLRDVSAVAGYVRTDAGRRCVVVGIINHPNANAARPALDALIEWSLHDSGDLEALK
jgi:D-alanyl-D-alanine carboxypeptidase/D-alanyl-D-alanine-endopeptidase (penicillin-binding protein 4)